MVFTVIFHFMLNAFTCRAAAIKADPKGPRMDDCILPPILRMFAHCPCLPNHLTNHACHILRKMHTQMLRRPYPAEDTLPPLLITSSIACKELINPDSRMSLKSKSYGCQCIVLLQHCYQNCPSCSGDCIVIQINACQCRVLLQRCCKTCQSFVPNSIIIEIKTCQC